jgi:phosphate transport system permease protein
MSGRRKTKDRAATIMLWLVMALTCGILALILAFLVSRGWSALSWEFLTKKPRSMMTAGGISTPIVGTLQLVLVSMGFAFPVGVFTAVYLVEYARDDWFTRALRLAVRSLAGVPSAGLTLGCLALPVIVGASESALLAVPKDYRDASYALGATQWQTVRKVVLPSAFPSIITGAILSVGRVAGETAPIIFTGAAFFAPRFAKSIFDQVMALPYHVLILATAGTNIEKTRPIQYGTVLVLLFFVLGMTMTGVLWRARLRIRQRAQR